MIRSLSTGVFLQPEIVWELDRILQPQVISLQCLVQSFRLLAKEFGFAPDILEYVPQPHSLLSVSSLAVALSSSASASVSAAMHSITTSARGTITGS